MPKKITAYQADDGSIHDDECAAATRDVELMVAASPLAENQPYARKLVEWLTGNSEQIRAVLETHERACPQSVQQSDAPQSLERTRVPYPGFPCFAHALDQYTMADVSKDNVADIIRAAAKKDKGRVLSFITSLGVETLADLLNKPELYNKAYAWAHNNFFIKGRPERVPADETDGDCS